METVVYHKKGIFDKLVYCDEDKTTDDIRYAGVGHAQEKVVTYLE